MSIAGLESSIDAAWEARDGLSPATRGAARDAVDAAIEALDRGEVRVAEKRDGKWHTNQWLKKAVLLSFRLYDTVPIPGGGDFMAVGNRGPAAWYDRSEEHTSELQSLKSISYAVICLQQKKLQITPT